MPFIMGQMSLHQKLMGRAPLLRVQHHRLPRCAWWMNNFYGEVWSAGDKVGDITADGEIWLAGDLISKIEPDGTIWYEGERIAGTEGGRWEYAALVIFYGFFDQFLE